MQITALVMDKNIYHERQSRQLCALHALNNLFQCQAFKKQDLDDICYELAPDSTTFFNPHRKFGLGCYDVNVIVAALSRKVYEIVWFDKRKKTSCLNLSNIFGFILNVPNHPGLASKAYIPTGLLFWSPEKHWVAFRKIGDEYYDLDSKLKAPCRIGKDEELLEHLQTYCDTEGVELLIVVSKTVSEDSSWIRAT